MTYHSPERNRGPNSYFVSSDEKLVPLKRVGSRIEVLEGLVGRWKENPSFRFCRKRSDGHDTDTVQVTGLVPLLMTSRHDHKAEESPAIQEHDALGRALIGGGSQRKVQWSGGGFRRERRKRISSAADWRLADRHLIVLNNIPVRSITCGNSWKWFVDDHLRLPATPSIGKMIRAG